MMPIMLFGGQFANSGNIQAWISWFQYISPIRYAFECFVRNEFDNREYNSTVVIQNKINPSLYLSFDISNSNSSSSASIDTTKWEIIHYPEVNPVSYAGFNVGLWRCLVILAALIVALRIMSFFFMKLLVSKFQ